MSRELIALNVQNPILTISLLTSHRKDTIRKCLDSITHLRETIPSELIIVDTGCNEEMRSIIEEYTDHIVKFTWCNDFSKARNAGLYEAKGKWFMYLDDDEWFEDTADIEKFFNSGAYKNCKACFYIQRNYTDMTGLSYSDDPVSRMFELIPELRFVGRIHEYLDPFDGVFTKADSYVHHYGYVFKSDKEKYEHSLRNLSLLKETLKEDRGQIRWWLQTAQEYNAIEEFDKMYELCEEGLTVFTKEATGNDKFLCRDVAGLYMGMIQSDIRTFKFEHAVENAKKALADGRLLDMAVAQCNVELARSYVQLKKYDEMRNACVKYFELYDRFHDNEVIIMEQTCFMVDETFTQKFYELMCWFMIVYAMDHNDIPMLREYYEKITWNQKRLFIYSRDTVFDVIRCLARNEFDVWFITAATNIVTRSDYVDEVCRLINEYEKKEDQTEFNRLVRIFSYINVRTYYLDYLKVLSLNVEGSKSLEREELINTVRLTFTEVTDVLSFKKEYWETLKRESIDIAPLICGINYDTWKNGVDTFCTESSISELEYISGLINEIAPVPEEDRQDGVSDESADERNIRFDYYDMRAVEGALQKGAGWTKYQELKDLLILFVSKELAFYRRLYRPEVFKTRAEVLPDDCRAALILEKGLAAESADDYKKALTAYKQVIGIRRNINDTVQEYAHLYADRVKESLPEVDEMGIDEQSSLEWKIRLKARQLEQMGHTEEAAEILKQLESIKAGNRNE